MRTEELIRTLAADAGTERPLRLTLAVTLAPALLVAFLGLVVTIGLREGLAVALSDPVSAMRIVLSLSLFAVAIGLCLVAARPERSPRLWPLAVIAAVAAGLWLWAFVATPTGGVQMAITGKTMVSCLVSIPLLSVLPVAAILWTLRRGAPTAPTRTGALAGLAGAGGAAAIYALHCTEDTWYGLAILIVTGVAAMVGGRVLRW
jgi:hypothetical protein